MPYQARAAYVGAEEIRSGAVGRVQDLGAFEMRCRVLQIPELVVRHTDVRLEVGQVGVELGRALEGFDGARGIVLLTGGEPRVVGRARVVGIRALGRLEGQLCLRVGAGLEQLETALELSLRACGARRAQQQEQGERPGDRARRRSARARGGGTDAAAR
jgi:hypothetical protein